MQFLPIALQRPVAGGVALLLVALGATFYALRRLRPLAYVWVLPAICWTVFCLQLSAVPSPLPLALRDFFLPAGTSAKTKPDYSRGLAATLVVEQVRGRTAVVRFLSAQKIGRIQRKRRAQFGKRRRAASHRRQFQRRRRGRRPAQIGKRGSYRQKWHRNARRRYRRSRGAHAQMARKSSGIVPNKATLGWGEQKPSAQRWGNSYRYRRRSRSRRQPFWKQFRKQGSPLPVESLRSMLRWNGAALSKGCRLKVMLYGRGLPRLLSAAESKRFERYGVALSLRLSRRYHVVHVSCGPGSVWQRLRVWVRGALSGPPLGGESAAVLRAMLLGDSKELGYGQTGRLRRLGIAHLFAASGLHMMVLVVALRFLPLRILGGRSRLARAFAIPFCFGYLCLLGFPVSLCRAFVFICAYTLAQCSGRVVRPSSVVSLSLLVLLAWQPYDLFSVAGLLSVGAVAGILYARAVLLRAFSVIGWQKFSDSAAVGAAARPAPRPPRSSYLVGFHF